MIERRQLIAAAIGTLLVPGAAHAQAAPTSSERMNDPGVENGMIAQRQGLWDMTETVWAAPGAAPLVTTGLVAERRMIGSLLQERLYPKSDGSDGAVKRMDLLTYNRIEGRWDYASFDTRVPAGLMPAKSFNKGDGSTIDLVFEPFAFTFDTSASLGQTLRLRQTITFESPDRDVKDQYFIRADGSATEWVAHRYAYVRRS